MVGVFDHAAFEHATLRVLVLSRCWFDDGGVWDLVLRCARPAPSAPLLHRCGPGSDMALGLWEGF